MDKIVKKQCKSIVEYNVLKISENIILFKIMCNAR